MNDKFEINERAIGKERPRYSSKTRNKIIVELEEINSVEVIDDE